MAIKKNDNEIMIANGTCDCEAPWKGVAAF